LLPRGASEWESGGSCTIGKFWSYAEDAKSPSSKFKKKKTITKKSKHIQTNRGTLGIFVYGHNHSTPFNLPWQFYTIT